MPFAKNFLENWKNALTRNGEPLLLNHNATENRCTVETEAGVRYPNLDAEMTRYGVTREDVAKRLGRSLPSAERLLNGKSRMTVELAFAVRDAVCPGVTIDYLFSPDPIPSV